MAKNERLITPADMGEDTDEDTSQPQRGSSRTRRALRRTAIGAVGVLPVAPGAALAQGPSPMLMDQIIRKQNEIRTYGLPYTYDNPNTIGTFISKQCITNYSDYIIRATTKRTSSNTLKTSLTGREGKVTAGLARLSYVTSAPGPATSFDFMCNTAGTDSVKARLEKKAKGGWKPNGPWKELSLSGRAFDVRPAGSDDPSFGAQATLKSRSSLSSSKLKAGRVRVKIKNSTTTSEGTGGNSTTAKIKRRKQSVTVYR